MHSTRSLNSKLLNPNPKKCPGQKILSWQVAPTGVPAGSHKRTSAKLRSNLRKTQARSWMRLRSRTLSRKSIEMDHFSILTGNRSQWIWMVRSTLPMRKYALIPRFVLEKAAMESAGRSRTTTRKMMRTSLKMRKSTTMKAMKCNTMTISKWKKEWTVGMSVE